MTIEKLKNDIENRNFNGPYILIAKDFGIINHYISNLKKSIDVNFLDTESYLRLSNSFYIDRESALFFKEEKLNVFNDSYLSIKNLFILVKDISKEIKKSYENYIIVLDKLEDWQINDYVFSLLGTNVDKKYINKFIEKYKNDFTKLDIELSKLRHLDKESVSFLIKENIFNIEDSKSIFSCINCLINGNDISLVYKSLIKEDPFSFVTLLLINIKNVLKVLCCKNPTEEHTGLSSKQIYAIGKSYSNTSINWLIHCYIELVHLYKNIRNGLIDSSLIIDIIIYVFYLGGYV